jgi:hypothetical protein
MLFHLLYDARNSGIRIRKFTIKLATRNPVGFEAYVLKLVMREEDQSTGKSAKILFAPSPIGNRERGVL